MEDPSPPKSSTREDPSSQNKSPATLPQPSSSHKEEEEGVEVKMGVADSSGTSSADHDSSLPSSQSLKDEKKDPPTPSSSSSEQGEEDNENVAEEREKNETVKEEQSKEEEIDESLPLVHFLNPTQIRKLERSRRKGKKPSRFVSPDQDVAVPSGSRHQETEDQQKNPANVATSETKAQAEEDSENVEEEIEKNETVEEEDEQDEEEDEEEQSKEEEEIDESLPLVHFLNPTQISKLERRQRKEKKPSSLVSPGQDVAVPSGSRPQETEDQQKIPANVATSETKAQEEEKPSDEAEGSEESQPKPRHLHMFGRLDPDATDSGSSEEGSSQPPVSYKQPVSYKADGKWHIHRELPPLKKTKEDDNTKKGD